MEIASHDEDSQTEGNVEDVSEISQQKETGSSGNNIIQNTVVATDSNDHPFDVVFSYHAQDQYIAEFLKTLLESSRPDLRLNFGLESEHEHLKSFDSAKLVVALLSSQYLLDAQCTGEFHIALNRHRASRGKSILYPIMTERLLPEPTFGYMFPCTIDIRDAHWSLLAETSDLSWLDKHYPRLGSINHVIALQACCLEILNHLTSPG